MAIIVMHTQMPGILMAGSGMVWLSVKCRQRLSL